MVRKDENYTMQEKKKKARNMKKKSIGIHFPVIDIENSSLSPRFSVIELPTAS